MNWRAKKREAGHRDVLVWLTPDAVTALAALQANHARTSVAEIISAAIVQVANDGLALDGGDQVVQADQLAEVQDQLGKMTNALADVQARLAHLETIPVETPTTPTETQVTAPKKPRTSGIGTGKGAIDADAIIAAVAVRRCRDGDDFNRAALWNDLKNAGVAVHATPANFSTAVRKIVARGSATA